MKATVSIKTKELTTMQLEKALQELLERVRINADVEVWSDHNGLTNITLGYTVDQFPYD